MTTYEFAARIASLPNGGVLTDESRLDRPYLISLINSAAAKVKRTKLIQAKRIHSSWMLPYYPVFNEIAQISDCYYKFKLPQIIALDARQTGLGYIGSIDCNNPYRVVENMAKFAAMQQHRLMKNRKNTVLIGNGELSLYGSAKEMRIDGLWYDPMSIPSFNLLKDQYPIDGDSVTDVETIITQSNLILITKTPTDIKQNKVDDSAILK